MEQNVLGPTCSHSRLLKQTKKSRYSKIKVQRINWYHETLVRKLLFLFCPQYCSSLMFSRQLTDTAFYLVSKLLPFRLYWLRVLSLGRRIRKPGSVWYGFFLHLIDNFIKKTIKILFTINSLKKKKKLFIHSFFVTNNNNNNNNNNNDNNNNNTRKLLTIHGALHPRSNVSRL